MMLKQQGYHCAAALLPLVMASLLGWFATGWRSMEQEIAPLDFWLMEQNLLPVKTMSAGELERYFDEQGYAWLPSLGATVPPYVVAKLPHDLSTIDNIKRKKALFFRALLPIVLAENENIRQQRKQLLKLIQKKNDTLSAAEIDWLTQLSQWYRVNGDVSALSVWHKLLKRVDEIPAAIVLAQAANESAWGTSRFARVGNNLFGMWTLDEQNGMIPARRNKGMHHAVRIYPDIQASIRSYLRNLNTHRAYHKLRKLRSAARKKGEPVSAVKLVTGLRSYSTRGDAYVREIRSMMRSNRLIKLNQVTLSLVEKIRATTSS